MPPTSTSQKALTPASMPIPYVSSTTSCVIVIPSESHSSKHKRNDDDIKVAANDATNSTANGAADDDDDEIEVISPPRKKAATHPSSRPLIQIDSPDASQSNHTFPGSQALEVLESNVTNPNIVYPHKRPDCGVHSYLEDPQNFCYNCYCVACDTPAHNCGEWNVHCRLEATIIAKQVDYDEVQIVESPTNVAQHAPHATHQAQQNQRNNRSVDAQRQAISANRSSRHPSQQRITEVLALNLAEEVEVADKRASHNPNGDGTIKTLAQVLPMNGDIPALKLQPSFFVEGIRIGWPFAEILPPQRQMAIHIIKGLKRKLHVVLESPTGTGKSAAILCSILGWQRYFGQTNIPVKPTALPQSNTTINADDSDNQARTGPGQDDNSSQISSPPITQVSTTTNTQNEVVVFENSAPKIIYCSRTHSQVAQMVASLQKTPYRPRVAILGSRDRLCINRALKDQKGTRKNQSCQSRRGRTEKERKQMYKDQTVHYDDNNPISKSEATSASRRGNARHDDEEAVQPNGDATSSGRPAPCPHYRQLTTKRTAQFAQSRFKPDANKISCCSLGGEKTKLGVHDIEDLVSFGKNPYYEKDVAFYRNGSRLGIILKKSESSHGCVVERVKTDMAARKNDVQLQRGDLVVKIGNKDTSRWSLQQVQNEIIQSKDPLTLSVLRRESDVTNSPDSEESTPLDEQYSKHAACPYYLSRALVVHAEIIFAPYNYVLDPVIRKAMSISLSGNVIVLDEAHNVEDTLCESGSGEFNEVDLCTLATILIHQSTKENDGDFFGDMLNDMGVEEGDASPDSHCLLLFVERIIIHMQKLRRDFERGPECERIKRERHIKKYPENKSFPVAFCGPTGRGVNGRATGCKPFLNQLGVTSKFCAALQVQAEAVELNMLGQNDDNQAVETGMRDLTTLVSRFVMAAQNPEHYFIQYEVTANGSMDYATMSESEYDESPMKNRRHKQPKRLPFAIPRTDAQPRANLPVCKHCIAKQHQQQVKQEGNADMMHDMPDSGIHGEYCDGTRPRWECKIVLRLLNPGLLMKDVSEQSRSVILASGSLAPLPSLCAELGLHGGEGPFSTRSQPITIEGDPAESKGRLQTAPKPLEANHVVNLSKQLFAVGIGHFPDGSPLKVNYANYKNDGFHDHLGEAIASIAESIPHGGVLVFFPSYSFLRKCIQCWDPCSQKGQHHRRSNVWARFNASKGIVVVEPTGSQDEFEIARQSYAESIKVNGKCMLLAVFRGKMSEGISFNDNNARCVICVGLPFPNAYDTTIKTKQAYNNEQRQVCKNQALLSGSEWYCQQAYRAIAQALGRCIRHGADYGTVVLMDSRFCDDGSPNHGICRNHERLPKWMRHCVRTLCPRNSPMGINNPVLGGYGGLQRELDKFFREAPVHGQKVKDKWALDRAKAEQKNEQNTDLSFDKTTGSWKADATSNAIVAVDVSDIEDLT